MPRGAHYTFTYSVVTPLFLGDALRDATRLSAASFKGALRFWWRALAWSDCWREARGDEQEALRDLHDREARLFGAAGEAGRCDRGQSRVRLAILDTAVGSPKPKNTYLVEENGRNALGPGARYLGYGLVGAFGNSAGRLERRAWREGVRFRLEVRFHPGLSESEQRGVLRALELMGLLGGLGARTRRGWGSLTLREVEGRDWSPPTTIENYAESVRRCIGRPEAPRPPFSAFSQETRIDVLLRRDHPLQALDAMGVAMVRYRAWGFKPKNQEENLILDNRENSLQIFKDDHDWAHAPWRGKKERYVPRRTAFGLPHNYGKRLRNLGVDTTGDSGAGNRRASPLLLHVHDLGEGGAIGVAIRFLARFTPDERVRVTWNGDAYDAPMRPDWPDVLAGLVEGGYPCGGADRPFFPERHPVLPEGGA